MTVRTVQGWALAILTVLFFAIAGTIGAPAARADGAFTGSDRLTPRPETVAPIGQLRLVATYTVPAADVGCLATFTVYAANGDSVHQANYGLHRQQRRPGRRPVHRIRGERRRHPSHRPDPRARRDDQLVQRHRTMD